MDRHILVMLMGMIMTGLFFCSPVTAGEYSLDDLYRIALERAETIKIAEQNFDISEITRKKAIAYLNPTLTAYTTYTRYTEDKRAAETNLGLVKLPGSLYQPYEVSAWGLRMDYRFSLSGNAITALRMADKTIEKSRFDLYAVKEEYLFQVTGIYYDYLKAKKLREIATANLDRLQKYRDAAEKRLKVGEVTRTVLLRAESELSSAQADLVKAINGVDLAKAALVSIVGIDKESQIIETPFRTVDLDPLPYYQEKGLEERADIRGLAIQKRLAEDQVKYNKGAYWPNLSLAAVYARLEQCPAASTLNRESMYAVASLNFPFYEGGLRMAEVKEAKAREKQAALRYDEFKKNIAIEIQRAYLELQTQRGSLAYLEAQRTYARENYHAVSRQFDFGLANSIDVLDATTALVAAEMKMAEAEYIFQVALLKMKKAIGVFLKDVAGHQPSTDKKLTP